MNVNRAFMMLTDLTRYYLDNEWAVRFYSRRKEFGQCDYAMTTIALSRPLTRQATEEQVLNTILHEIAHALTPNAVWTGNTLQSALDAVNNYATTRGHTEAWRATCLELGGDGKERFDRKALGLSTGGNL